MISNPILGPLFEGRAAARWGANNQLCLPKEGLLLYLGRPNLEAADVPIGDDTEIGDDTIIRWMFLLPADADIRAATGWVVGIGNIFYDAAGDPIAVLASEIAAWSSINQWNVLFHLVSAETETGRLAIYDINTPLATLNKALKVLREDQIDLPPTAYFNGVFTHSQITAEGGTYTGGPTSFADNLGMLQTAPSGVPALQGMRLATKAADGAVLGPELITNAADREFTGDTGFWVKTNAIISGGEANLAVDNAAITNITLLTPGNTYTVYFKITLFTATSIRLYAATTSSSNINNYFQYTASGLYSYTFTYLNSNQLRFLAMGGSGTVDDVSLKKLIPTYYDTALDGTPILPSRPQPTRTFDAGFTTSVPGLTYKRYTRTNPAVDLPGYLCEPARTNYALNSSVPATHTTGTVPVGTYTLWQEGTGSITATAGTAFGTFGAASNGTPATITITTAGTVVLTTSGTNTWAQLESGPFKTSRILTTSAAAVRQGTVLSFPTAGKIRSNNMAFLQTVVPRATGQLNVYVLGSYTDADNYTAVIVDATTVTFRKRIVGVNTDATVSITHAKDTPLQILTVWTESGVLVAVRAYSGGAWSAWTDGTLNSSDGAKANAIIGVNYQLGALNSASQFTGNLSELGTRFIPDGIADPLAWVKQQWGLPA